MLDGLGSAWNIVGQVAELRELTSQKSKDWRGYVVKMATMGSTFEALCSPDVWKGLQIGQLCKFAGHLEDQRGTLRLMLDRVTPANVSKVPA
jgi:hypothetical protein